MIHVNDKLAPSAHQKLLQHVLTREDLKCIRQKEHNREDNAIVQKCNEVWNTNLQKRGQKEPTTLHDPLVTLATALYKWGACVCLLCATPILSDIQQTTTDTQHILSTTLKHDHTPTSPNGQNNQQLKRRTSTPSRERELFIGTQFSIRYTSLPRLLRHFTCNPSTVWAHPLQLSTSLRPLLCTSTVRKMETPMVGMRMGAEHEDRLIT
jgi:hypothetical protein